MKNRTKYFNLFILSAIALLVGFASCNDNNNYINPKELIEAELELLDRYYNEEMESGLTRIDSMTAAAIDTVDNRMESGLMLFHTKIGEGDSIKIYNKVAYRYKRYAIAQDSLDVTYEAPAGLDWNNEYANAPMFYTTYLLNDGTSANSTGVPLGINEALLNMRFGGEAKIVLPSSIGGVSGYYTTIYDIRVTYLEQ